MFDTYRKVFVAAGLICCLLSSVFAYSGGTGEPNNPYQIANVADFNQLTLDPNNWNKSFILTANINLTSLTFTQAPIAPDTNSTDWDFQGTPFTGIFDGNGHSILNLTINVGWTNKDHLGLFGRIGAGGIVKNLGIEDVNIIVILGDNYYSYYVGGLCGSSKQSNISNCYSTGQVTGGSSSGGLCGSIVESNISNCYSTGNINGYDYIGGLCGYSEQSNISNCYSTGEVTGIDGTGGLCGSIVESNISNCHSTDNVTGYGERNGGLCGYNEGAGGSITNCYSTGNVSGNNLTGGLCGYNNGSSFKVSITNCYSTGTVSGSSYVGGLMGHNYGIISQCYSTGSVSSSHHSYVGGLVGDNYGTISNCYSAGAVSSTSSYVGGLVGQNDGSSSSISNCYSTGTVSGYSNVGGLVGKNYDGSISNCYSMGAVSCDGSDIGGLVGINGGSISDCYSTGAVSGTFRVGGLVGHHSNSSISNCYSTGTVSGYDYVGGLVGYYYGGTVNNSFWDVNTSGWSTSAGGTGKTTAEMKTLSTFTSAGWNFIAVWDIVQGQTYPFFFKKENYSGGTGTPDDPYEIADANELRTLAGTVADYNKCFILAADIDMAGCVSAMAIIAADTSSSTGFQGTAFTGTFDGDGHKITHFTINGTNDFLGLFGDIGSGGQIKNLGLENFSVSGSYFSGGLVGESDYGTISNCYSTGSVSGFSYVGGLVGGNYGGTISNCYSTGTVSGSFEYVGGLVGDAYHGTTISNCCSTGSVSGSSYVGGLGGYNYHSSISNCYSTGAVSGNQFVGGLMGYNTSSGSVDNCYSTGAVSGSSYVGGLVGYNDSGITNNSFWDVNTSGWSTSDGGTGKTTAQMKTLTTFTDAGWDFDFDWFIQIDEYPILTWQISPVDIYTDGKNNFRDFAVLARFWMRDDCEIYNNYCDGADLDFNHVVDIYDLKKFIRYWLQSGIYD